MKKLTVPMFTDMLEIHGHGVKNKSNKQVNLLKCRQGQKARTRIIRTCITYGHQIINTP